AVGPGASNTWTAEPRSRKPPWAKERSCCWVRKSTSAISPTEPSSCYSTACITAARKRWPCSNSGIMAVTIKDVARESGVNVSTVSRALNGEYGVHVETREMVTAIAERLGYRPNRVARGLVTGRSHTLALVVSDIRNPFFAEVARGAEDAACRAGHDLILCNSDLDPEKQMRYVQS